MTGWFTENKGQFGNREVKFVYPGSDCSIGFVESGYLITLTGEDNRTSVVNARFEGAKLVVPEGREERPHKSNYFYGNDPEQWRTDVPNYNNVIYKALYDGIDLLFYTTEEGLKYDFLVSPGADPEEICWSYEGVDDLFIDTLGKLHITTPAGELVEEAPVSYQMNDDKKTEISSGYRIDDEKVTFVIGEYDSSQPLVIDPLIYSTFVGGNRDDRSLGLVLDSENNAYVTGFTGSSDFPTTSGSFDESNNGGMEIFVFKLSSDGSDLVYSTFIGGERGDEGYGIALDSDNNVYITGTTKSEDFPVTPGAYDDTHNGGNDVFVCKLNATGSGLVYSTFISKGYGYGIDVDSENNAYVTGETMYSKFPTTSGAYDESYNGGEDIFVFKLNWNGSELLYSTYVGGDLGEEGSALVLDAMSNAYVTGWTRSSDFPTTDGCIDGSFNGEYDIVVFSMNPNGSDLRYSTYIGGENEERGKSIAVDIANNTYVVGHTNSEDFPTTTGCLDDSYNGGGLSVIGDGVVCKVNLNGTDLLYSTYLGGGKSDVLSGIDVDSEQNAYVVGHSASTDFPTTTDCYDDAHNGARDLVVSKLDSDGSELLYSTFFGGSGPDGEWWERIALDSENNAYIIGNTESSDLPVTAGCFDDSHNGDYDVVVMKLNFGKKPIAIITSISPDPGVEGKKIRFSGRGAVDNRSIETFVWRSNLEGELYNGTKEEFNSSGLSAGNHVIFLKVKDGSGNWSEETNRTLLVHEKPEAAIDSISPNPARESQTIRFQGHGTDDGTVERYVWTSSLDGELHNDTDAEFSSSSLSNGSHTISFKVQDNYGVWSNDVSTTLTINGVPRANIDSVSPNPARESQTIYFQGSGTDDGTVERYVWTSSLDGEIHNDTDAEFSSSSLSNGSHTITFKVQDDDDAWSDEVSTPLTINGIPRAKIDSVSPNPAQESQRIYFQGNGTDDGTVERYVWRSSLDGEIYNGTESEFSTSSLSNGSHTINFKVRDNDGVWSEEVSTTVRVSGNPRAIIDSISPNPVLEGKRVVFKGNGTDDGAIEQYAWRSSIDGEIYNGTESEFSISSLSRETHNILLQVKDDSGNWSKEVNATLIVHGKPVAVIKSVSPNPANEEEDVRFKADGTDDGTIVAYAWRSSIDGEFYNGTRNDIKYDELSSGNHTMYLSVMDNYDVWSDEVSVTLDINARPVAVIETISPNLAWEGQEVKFQGHGDDDGTIITYRWRSSRDGILNASNSFTTTSLSVGTHAIYFRVQDDNEFWSEEVSSTVIIHEKPVAVIDSISPNPALDMESVHFRGSGTDDGSVERYNWRTENEEIYNGTEPEFDYDGLTPGTHTIYFKVLDNHAAWSDEVNTSLTVHTRPIASIDDISPNPGLNTNVLAFEGNGTDDGTIENTNWRIENGTGGEVYNGSTPPVNFPVGNYTVYFKVQDNHGIWSEEVSIGLVIHEKPVIETSSVSVTTAFVGEPVQFIGIASDDGAVERYLWTSSIDGEFYNGTETEFFDSTLSTGTHIITLVVQDNNGAWSDEETFTLLVHGKPIAIIVSISPSPAHDTDTITFTGEGTGGGAIIRYVWTSSISGEFYNGTEATVASSNLPVGEHSIAFKVLDEYDLWSEEVSTILVVKSPNTPPTVTITSPTNGSDVKGTITIKGTATDEDGTVEKVEISINGGEWVAVTGIDSWNYEWDSTTVKNGNYEIKVKAFDGEDYSEEVVWKVTVENEEDDGGEGEAGFLPGFELMGAILGLLAAAIYLRKRP